MAFGDVLGKSCFLCGRGGTADNGTKILPVDRNYKGLELELRGFRDCALKNRMEIVLIAESREDRVGWFDAIQQVIKKEE